METTQLTLQLPAGEVIFLEEYTRRHKLTMTELFDSYIKLLQQTEHRYSMTESYQHLKIQESTRLENKKSNSIEEFLEKWTGFLEGINPDDARFQYLQEKYR